MADVGVDTLSINSPRGLSRALIAAREFLYRSLFVLTVLFRFHSSVLRRSWAITLHEFGLTTAEEYIVLQDSNVTVSAVPFLPSASSSLTGSSSTTTTTAVGAAPTTTTTCKHRVQMFPAQLAALRSSNCDCTRQRPECAESVVYIVKCADMPGKFDAAKARALGIEGPSRGL